MSVPSPPADPTAFDRRAWVTLLVLCGVLFLDGLDVSMVGVALPSIDADLGLSTSTLQWVVSGYVLGYGGLLLLGGRTADLLGRRRVLLVALAVFAAASLLGALVDDGALLIAARFIKGAAAAFTAPAGLSIITTTFHEGPARNRALGIYTATGASGFSLGLVLGGILTTAGWRWTFLLPFPIAVVLLIAAWRLLRPDPPRVAGQGRFDLARRRVGDRRDARARVRHLGRAGRRLDVGPDARRVRAGGRSSVRRSSPPNGGSRTRSSGSGSCARPRSRARTSPAWRCSRATSASSSWSRSTCRTCWAGRALETALAFLPAGLLVAFGAPRMGPLATRVGTAPLIAGGLLSFVAGYALFIPIDASPAYPVAILPTMLLLGLGFALTYPAVNMAATSGVADHEQGLASGLVSTSFQLGGAVGLAIVTAVITSGETGASSLLDQLRPGLAVVTGMAVLGLTSVLGAVLAQRRLEARLAAA